MAFYNVLLPTSICHAYGSSGGVQFSTSITPKGDGNEARNSNWGANGRATYDIAQAITDQETFEELYSFFRFVQGRAYSFRFLNVMDFIAQDAPLDTSAGGTTFQLRKEYSITEWTWENSGITPDVHKHYRTIYLPDPGTLYLTLNGSPVPVEENDYYSSLFGDPMFNPSAQLTASVNSQTGIVTLSESISAGDELVASFNFHLKCRFDTDRMQTTYTNWQAYQSSLPIIEVVE